MRTDIENGMVIGAARAFERSQGPEVKYADLCEARDQVLLDLETLTDEWAANCARTAPTDGDKQMLALVVRNAISAKPEACMFAVRALLNAYARRNSDRIDKLAEQIAWDRAADEAEQ